MDAVLNDIPRRYPWAGPELVNNYEDVEATGLSTNYEVMLEQVWRDTL